MSELSGIDLATHLKAIFTEFKSHKSIYSYPDNKIFRGFPGKDFSVNFFGRKAFTSLGPAAGPHTQMAQNIVLSFLAGSRIIELKTIQILDELTIPRPCINIPNVGYNIEWSQELKLEDSLQEYLIAWIILKIIEEEELLGIKKGDPFYNKIFDISVGYDLKGISSPPVNKWLKKIMNAEDEISILLASLPDEFAHYKNLSIDPNISHTTTLSTFHGCPADEIESIVEHLIDEHGLHVIVKMNPTILGYDFVDNILHDELGYKHIELDRAAFDKDLKFDEGVAMMKRLEKFAESKNKKVGAKFTNTLVVKNDQNVFVGEEMYLSGAPLHVLSMNAMHKFRSEMSPDFHISFSAGITKNNIVDAVKCNMKPITSCSDLLTTGGYIRMYEYLFTLNKEMNKVECNNIDEFVIISADDKKVKDVNSAGVINAQRIVPQLVNNPRYHHNKNKNEPPKIDSHLVLFDCITCNKCIPVCPNAANFSIPIGKKNFKYVDYQFSKGKLIPSTHQYFVLDYEHQIANLADFCNDCGDCDTYCPEFGGPFIEKPRFFFNEENYSKYKNDNGFYFADSSTLHGRIGKSEYELSYIENDNNFKWTNKNFELFLDENNNLVDVKLLNDIDDGTQIDMKDYYIMKTLFLGIKNNKEIYPAVLLLND